MKKIEYKGISVEVKLKKTIIIKLSQERLDCIVAQLDEALGGDIGEDDFPELKDFMDALSEAQRGET